MFESSNSDLGEDEEITYQQLENFDEISVDLVPEKKGLILKHCEYLVTSRRHGTTVHRRYSDFVVLHDILLAKYPYRAVCRLPPKRVTVGGGSAVFLERRRAGLRRWLALTAAHPVLAHDADTRAFLCEPAPPALRPAPDEFVLASPQLTQAECVTEEMMEEFKNEQEQLGLMYFAFNRLNQIFSLAEQRCEAERDAVIEVGGVLASLSAPAPRPARADSAPEWQRVRRALGKAALSTRGAAWSMEERAGWERLRLATEALAAHRDLCCRLTRATHTDRQTASRTQPGAVGVAGAASVARARHCYALRCARAESRLARARALAALEALADLAHAAALVCARAATQWSELRGAFVGGS